MSSFTFSLADTVNGAVACDQIRQEISNSGIAVSLMPDPNGVVCTKTVVIFHFLGPLTAGDQSILAGIVATHTGEGLLSPNSLESSAVADLPDDGNAGDSLFVTDGNEGPAPAWFDGSSWRWYASGAIVAP